MSSFIHKLKVFLGVEEEYEEEEQLEETPYQEDIVALRRERTRKSATSDRGISKPTLIGLSGGQTGQAGQSKMYIIEPQAFEEVKSCVDHLRNRKCLIMRLHLVDKAEAQRIVDFMSGTTHALDGNMRKLGETIFCFTPDSVIIEGDLEADFFQMIRNEED